MEEEINELKKRIIALENQEQLEKRYNMLMSKLEEKLLCIDDPTLMISKNKQGIVSRVELSISERHDLILKILDILVKEELSANYVDYILDVVKGDYKNLRIFDRSQK